MVKSNSLIMSVIVLACLDYFPFFLPRTCLFRIAAVSSGLFHIFQTKVKARKARQKLETLPKVKASQVYKKMKACKSRKKMKVRKSPKK